MSTARLAAVLLGAAATACNTVPPERADASGSAAAQSSQAAGDCTPLETREPNAPHQRPAFPGQTRACSVRSAVAWEVVVVAKGLEHPWSVEPLPGGDFLVTERPGRLRLVSAGGEVGEPIEGVPPVHAHGQGGLLDLALSSRFASDRTLFWSYSEPRQDGSGTSVARGVLSADGRRLEQVRVILRTRPSYTSDLHYGSRLVVAPDGMLFVTLGERSDAQTRPQAQRLDSHLGKILRITPEGEAPKDNPFVGKPGALPEIWTLGHRNVQSAVLDPEGRLWAVEHGARGGDELNRIAKGKNYGWPIAAYGEEYAGTPIGSGVTEREGFESPIYYWDPVIAPSGAELYTGNAFPAWRGSLFIGALREHRLVRLTLHGDRVTGEEHLLAERGQRVRDLRQGPDGALYIVTDEQDGELWKLAPRQGARP